MIKYGKHKSKTNGRRSQKVGDDAEVLAMHRLKFAGLVQVVKINTGQSANGVYKKRVEGDIRAIVNGSGRAVLCEVKYRVDKLVYSNLQDHQHRALSVAAEAGALCLLCWVSPAGCLFLRYPVHNLKKGGRALTWDVAQALAFDFTDV